MKVKTNQRKSGHVKGCLKKIPSRSKHSLKTKKKETHETMKLSKRGKRHARPLHTLFFFGFCVSECVVARGVATQC